VTWAGRTIVVMLLIPITGYASTVLPRPFIAVPVLLMPLMFYGVGRTAWHLHRAAKLRREEAVGEPSPFRNPMIRFLNSNFGRQGRQYAVCRHVRSRQRQSAELRQLGAP
jgi:hypothetical protein